MHNGGLVFGAVELSDTYLKHPAREIVGLFCEVYEFLFGEAQQHAILARLEIVEGRVAAEETERGYEECAGESKSECVFFCAVETCDSDNTGSNHVDIGLDFAGRDNQFFFLEFNGRAVFDDEVDSGVGGIIQAFPAESVT